MSAKGREGSRLLTSQPGNLRGLILCGGLLLFGSLCGCGVGDRLLQAQPAEKSDAKATTNRLARETSPYLLLHAHNPVDWYPWGPEAFAKAKRENKLIFLSIGYSSCFWCHVMEREVFSNPTIAAFMNEHFVNIKVDREERPDIDEIYMTSLQVYYQLSGVRSAGGWPLSMFLTPDLLPLAGGTYFPPEDTEDRTGFRSILKTIDTAWNERPAELKETADTLTDAVRSTLRQRPVLTPVKLEPALLQQVVAELQGGFDSEYGGFDYKADQPQRPKFPTPVRLAFLQSYAAQQQDEVLQQQILLTLDRMANGGIHDQLGGGFHRYSTDRFWRVPHFEKMLYDNSQLIGVYLTAYEQTQEPRYRRVAEGIIGFVLRELTDKSGAFYSALDAETDGVEGEYYVWTRDEIQQTLSAEDVRLLALHHGLDQPPNFEEKYVLEVIRTPDELAKELNLPVEELQPRLRQAQAALWKVRQKRKPLLRDDKILVAWNGLMIQSLARAGRVLQNDDYTAAAERAALFLMEHLRDRTGDLLHSYCAGEAKLPAYVDDYALLISGLLELQTTTGAEKWLSAAVRLQAKQDELFWDDRGQGYFHAAAAHEQPILRTQQVADLIMPSGNSASARNLLQLAVLADQPPLRERAAVLLKSGAPRLLNSARSSATLATALQEYLAAEQSAPEKNGDESPKADEEKPNESSGIDSETPDITSNLETEQNPLLLAAAEEPAAPTEPATKDTPAVEKKKPQHVTGHVYLPYEKLPAGKDSEVLIRLEILEGWHINPNPAPDEFTLPTDVTLKSQLGIELDGLVFPKPKKKEVTGLKKTLLYYEGRTLIRGQLVIPADAAGKTAELELKVKYQACNDDVCLTPKTLTIKVPVTIARPGEPLKPINEKLFPKQ